MLGIGKSTCQAKVIFNDNQLYAGAVVNVLANIDNSTCKNDVDYVQLYLIQTVKTKLNNQYSPFQMDTNITHVRQKVNLPAKDQQSVEIALDIPLKKQGKVKTYQKGPVVEEMRLLQPSFNGKQVSINYELELTIKHKGWNTDGKGKAVKLPIWIHSTNPAESRVQQPHVQTRPQQQPQP